MEEDFDEVASGKKEWNKVISDFYSPFHDTVETTLNNKEYNNVSRELGTDPVSGKTITAKFGKYGPYIQKGEGEDRTFANLAPGQLIESITLEQALKLFELPRTVGEYKGMSVICTKGRFGPYIKLGDKNISMPRGTDPLSIGLEECIEIIEKSLIKAEKKAIHDFSESGIQVLDGAYGPYIKFDGGNYRIPKGTDAETLTEEACKEIIANGKPTGKRRKKA